MALNNKKFLFLFLFFVVAMIALLFFSGGTSDNPKPVENNNSSENNIPLRTIRRTNTWFSSLYEHFPSQMIIAHPGAYRFSQKGLEVFGPNPVATPNTVFGGFTPFCALSGGLAVSGAAIEGYGDWNVVVSVNEDNVIWQARFTQGMPVVNISIPTQKLLADCSASGELSIINQDSILVKNEFGAILLQAKSGSVEDLGDKRVVMISNAGEFRVSILPEISENIISLFSNNDWALVNTHFSWTQKDKKFQTRYSFLSDSPAPVLTTVWPHHQQAISGGYQPDKVLGTYDTLLGKMDLVSTKEILMEIDATELPISFKKVTAAHYTQVIKSKIKSDAVRLKESISPEGVYFKGTWLGSLASLVQLADLYDLSDEKETLLNRLEMEIKSSLGKFSYDNQGKLLVATNTEFGNEKGNDHHFHYGYYIRAAAVLAQYRPETLLVTREIINDLASDIAETNRLSERYPFLRVFSPYESHSWADGYAPFDDGNNQESTSEALNAWYALTLWGRISQQAELTGWGEWLFANELLGTKTYWFANGNPFPPEYAHPMASMVWGGKRDFATWFSPDSMHIYGIQWLPITPASDYLKKIDGFESWVADISRGHSAPEKHEWGDLYVAQHSFFDPQHALELVKGVVSFEGLKLESLLYQTVYQNSQTP